jgi:apolipoprotein N-acyltransferase
VSLPRDTLVIMAAGAVVPLGFAPFEWRFVPVVALAVLALVLEGAGPKRAAFRSFVFGVGMFGVGVSWIYNSLHDYGSASVAVAGLFAAGMVVVNALCLTVLGYAYARWFGRISAGVRLTVFAALWTLIEWLRSWLFTGFPWLFLGYSQVDTPLGGYAPVGGVLLASFLGVAVASAAVWAMLGSARFRLAGIAGIVAVLVVGWMLGRVDWTAPAGKPVSVALVQGAIPQDRKMGPDRVSISLERYTALSRDYWDHDLVIWPETAIPARAFRVESFLENMEQRLERRDTKLLTGIFMQDFERDRYYNSLLALGGGSRQVYHKQRLVPFGEYMPMRGLLEFVNRFIDIPMSDIASGPVMPPVELAGYPAALGICYESAYPGVYRRQLPGAAFMVNVSNDAWFGDSLAPHQHLEIARIRALEAGRYMLRATNDGISAVIAPDGRVTRRGRQFAAEVISAEAIPYAGATPFVRWGHGPVIGLCALIVAAGVYTGRRGRA